MTKNNAIKLLTIHEREFGPPFDIVRGAIHDQNYQIIEYVEKQWGPTNLTHIRHMVTDDMLEDFKKMGETSNRVLIAMVITLILAVLGWIGFMIPFIYKLLNETPSR